MTEQKAIETLEYIKYCNDYKGCAESIALDIAIKSMEKQISKKLMKKWDYTRGSHDFYRWTCSKCERDIKGISAEYEYCPYCGQKLDWSEEE